MIAPSDRALRTYAVEPAAPFGVAADHAEIDVVAAGHVEEQAECLAILGEIDDAAVDRLARRRVIHRPAVKSVTVPAVRGFGTVDHPREFRSPGADQTG